MGQRLMELSRGIDATRLSENTVRKSISSETTLSADIKGFETVKQVLLDHSQTVGRQLRKKGWVCTVVFIKLKFSDFSQITRQKKLDDPICSSAAIFYEALALYRKIQLSKKIRLVGVGVGGLKDKDAPFQMSLITRESRQKKQWESVDEAVDTIAEKFGTNVIKKASLNRSIQEKKNGKQN